MIKLHRLQAKKARLAQEQHLKKKLQALQRGSVKMESDEEDEYEEDLDEYEDDFIDDGPIDDPYANGYSQHIKEIFKYDKSKFKDVEDDDIEESSFTRCMAEEVISKVRCPTTLRALREFFKEPPLRVELVRS